MRTKIIPSYLYVQYQDDPDLPAFIAAFNTLAQQYLDWFNTLNLPNYTVQAGAALDWVAQGLYGMVRPVLPQGSYSSIGAYNTTPYDTLEYDGKKDTGPSGFYVTTDDIFKRCITWNFYKGDGTQFNIAWLKRRVMRFLYGVDGVPPAIDNTYPVSVTISTTYVVTIALSPGVYPDLGPLLQSAIEAGVLLLPFQFTYTVTY